MQEVNSAVQTLDRVFNPKSIAIVGASESLDKVGGRVLAALIHNGFMGGIYAVNPGREMLQGRKCYPGLLALPEAPDLAIFAVPANQVRDQLEAAGRIGTCAVIIFTSGFAELSPAGALEQEALQKVASHYGMRLIGPNCLGVMNGRNGVIASSTVTMRDQIMPSGRLAFVSHSGAIATYWLMEILQRELGVSKWVSTGNEADIDLSEVVDYLVDDPETDVISLYIEGIRDGLRLRRAFARAAHRRKPIIVLKSGRTAAGAEAAASHTGALAGEDAIYSALFEQYGVCQVDSLREMLDVSRVLLTQRPVLGRRACVVSLSGGAGALMTDQASRNGYDIPPLSGALLAKLQMIMPAYVQVRNPIDLSDRIIIDVDMYRRVLELLMQSGEFDAIFTFMAGRVPRLVDEARNASIELFPAWSGAYANVWQATFPDLTTNLSKAGVLAFEEIPEAIRAVANARRFAEVWNNPPSDAVPDGLCNKGDYVLLSEIMSKRLLVDRAAIAVPNGELLTPGERLYPSPRIKPPYAVKLQSPALPHKSEYDAIRIGVESMEQIAEIGDAMLAMAAEKQLPVDGILLETMEKIEIELLVGLSSDPTFGPFLTIGRGGVEVDVDPDVLRFFLPLSAANVAAMLSRLRCSKLLNGFRGRPAAPIAELANVVERLAALFVGDPGLAEIEINPLAVCKGGRIVAIDAAVRVQKQVPGIAARND